MAWERANHPHGPHRNRVQVPTLFANLPNNTRAMLEEQDANGSMVEVQVRDPLLGMGTCTRDTRT